MLDIWPARQAYRNQESSNIGFVGSRENLADSLTGPDIQKAWLALLKTDESYVHRRCDIACEAGTVRNKCHKVFSSSLVQSLARSTLFKEEHRFLEIATKQSYLLDIVNVYLSIGVMKSRREAYLLLGPNKHIVNEEFSP